MKGKKRKQTEKKKQHKENYSEKEFQLPPSYEAQKVIQRGDTVEHLNI